MNVAAEFCDVHDSKIEELKCSKLLHRKMNRMKKNPREIFLVLEKFKSLLAFINFHLASKQQ
jgi:hypothetical protein